MKTLPNFFRVDLSRHKEFLATLPLGKISEEHGHTLAALMGNEDTKTGKGMWSYGGDIALYDLAQAEVFLNDKNSNDYPTNPLFSNVVGLALTSGGVSSRLYLHFNV